MSLARAFWLFAALAAAGVALIAGWSAPRIDAGGLAPFDTRIQGYALDEARAFLMALSDEGRAAYLGPQRVADTIFPIGLLGVLVIGTVLALRRWSPWLAGLAVLPALGYFVFDMLENAAVAGMLRAGADGVHAASVARASFFTIWKFHLVDAAILVLLLGWGLWILAWWRARRAA